MPQVCSLVASTIKGGIGFKGRLPWRIPEDMRQYEHISRKYGRKDNGINGVVMGRRTLDSLPQAFRPLPDRRTCVVSSTLTPPSPKTFEVAPDLESALERLKSECDCIFVSGGAAIYDEAHRNGLAQRIFWTRVCGPDIETDTKIDTQAILSKYDVLAITKTKSVGQYTYDFLVLDRKGLNLPPPQESDFPPRPEALPLRSSTLSCLAPNSLSAFPKLSMDGHEELQYLNIMETIIKTGLETDDRTGVGTLMKWGAMMRFDLRDSFPLLTTKRVYWKGVVEELLWFLQGRTDGNYLSERDVHIWDANGTKEFLEKRGLGHRRAGDLGPVYGFQWRHFGAEYKTCDDDYSGKGVDQVQEVIDTIRKDPQSRRIILTAWNPAALDEMALPPCHMMCQFFVDPKLKELSCTLYQRSADWGLGIPFNIASYSLLTMIIAQLTGLKAREFVHVVGNAHVYKNHVDPLQAQLKRIPRPFPRVLIDKSPKTVDDFRPEHFSLIGYEPWPTVKMAMAV